VYFGDDCRIPKHFPGLGRYIVQCTVYTGNCGRKACESRALILGCSVPVAQIIPGCYRCRLFVGCVSSTFIFSFVIKIKIACL